MHFVLLLFFLAFTLSFSISLLFFFKFLNVHRINLQVSEPLVSCSLSKLVEDVELKRETSSPVLDLQGAESGELEEPTGSGEGTGRARKKKKRAKKKKVNFLERFGENEAGEHIILGGLNSRRDCDGFLPVKSHLTCLNPFTSTSSVFQRKIKQRYDELVRSSEANELTIAQVGDFSNCLMQTKNELQIKSEVTKRKFSIAKALLFKADRSSIERQRQQIYKLEVEQKRLEEDALVCDWLQQQLALSPLYNKMVEISNSVEQEKLDEGLEYDDGDISFEELLAQEKKDSYWQKNAKSRQLGSLQ